MLAPGFNVSGTFSSEFQVVHFIRLKTLALSWRHTRTLNGWNKQVPVFHQVIPLQAVVIQFDDNLLMFNHAKNLHE